jgi:acyl transferase domain-containing protein/NADPH:quinone reductase-like Zn-dependent oxidoreductase/acyl carrier protein
MNSSNMNGNGNGNGLGNGHVNSLSRSHHERREPLAIVGMACRYPGDANSPSEFWKLLCEGRDCVREVPPERWSLPAFYDPELGRPGKIYSRRAGFINGMDQFDPHFFGISAREAQAMDPQQRLLLECAWEALEDSGTLPQDLAGSKTAVFVGISTHDYGDLMSVPTERKTSSNPYLGLGSALCIAANRISYCFDLRGPSLAVDTACSSSLVALHLACESLWQKESGAALVGGSNAILKPEMTAAFSAAGMLSPEGRSKSFDAQANGYVRAEGAGMLYIKPLSAARRDGDRIYAVILATAVNQDGQTPGISVPNGEAQADLLREACNRAGVRPTDVQYLEAHGTGTPVGDPIEANALGQVFGLNRPSPCVIGSVKSNIGHLEAGAGIAGVVKTALALRHRTLPPSLHFEKPNPQIDMQALGLRVVHQLEPWPETYGAPRMAGVNSFGFGGTNAHALLAETPAEISLFSKNGNGTHDSHENEALLFPLTARSKEALEAMARRYHDHVANDSGKNVNLGDLAYTLGVRRTHHQHRLAITADSRERLAEQLQAFAQGEKSPNWSTGKAASQDKLPIVFVFTGMGPQWWGMGQQLLRQEPVFREAVERCDRHFRRYMRDSLLQEMSSTEERSRIQKDDRFAQMGIFAVQVGLAALWESWGIRPSIVLGHSVGEVAASYVSGALSFEDAIHVCFHRSRLQHQTSGQGKMVAIGLSFEETRRLLLPYEGLVGIAAINGPQSITLSGDADALAEIHDELSIEGTFSRMLQVEVPYHSSKMDCLREELMDVLSSLTPQRPTVPLVSTVTAGFLDDDGMNAAYWWRNVREAVQFGPTVEKLLETGYNLFLEVGPHPVLAASIQQSALACDRQATVLASLRRKEPERATLLSALGKLYTLGLEVDWSRFHPHGRHLVSLPTYPWQRERFWRETELSRQLRTGEADWSSIGHMGRTVHPILGHALTTAHSEPAWNIDLDVQRDHAWLADHRVQGAIVYPAAAHVESAFAASVQLFGEDFACVENLELDRPLFLTVGSLQPVQLLVDRSQKMYGLYGHQPEGAWLRYSSGKLQRRINPTSPPEPRDNIESRFPRLRDKTECYEKFKSIGLDYGPGFATIEELRSGDRETLARIRLGASVQAQLDQYLLFPALLDAAFQSLLGVMEGTRLQLYLPARMRRIQLHRRLNAASELLFTSHARLVFRDDARLVGDISIFDVEGNLVAEVEGLRCNALAERNRRDLVVEECTHHEVWQLAAIPQIPRANTPAWRLPAAREIAKAAKDATGSSCPQAETGIAARLRRLEMAYIREALEQLRLGTSAPDPVDPNYGKLLARLLCFLNDKETSHRTEEAQTAAEQWLQCYQDLPAFHPRLMLLHSAAARLPDVLRGTVAPTELLYPGGSRTGLTYFYQSDPNWRNCYATAQRLVTQIIDRLPSERPLKILEVGGGIGCLTAQIAPLLPAHRTTYVFTDASAELVSEARERLADYPFVNVQQLDLEQDPLTQGLEPSSFDLVLASDTLHAVTNVVQTLGRLKKLLVSGGLLLVSEPVVDELLPVFGPQPGWSLFADHDLRPDSPLLTAEQWQSALQQAGFTAAEAVEGMQSHAVLLAQGPEIAVTAETREVAPGEFIGDWLILADQGGLGETLAGALKEQGARAVLAWQGPAFARLEDDRYQVRPDDETDLERLLMEALPASCAGIVFLWGSDLPSPVAGNAQALSAAQARLCASIVNFSRLITDLGYARPPRLWVVTQGSQAVGGERTPDAAPAALWGLTRVLANEQPELRPVLVDVSRKIDGDEINSLVRELVSTEREEEIALRGRDRYVHRLMPLGAFDAKDAARTQAQASQTSYRLESPKTGLVDDLALRACDRSKPGKAQVEIEVLAAPLNFKDVAKAMHLLGDASLEGTFSGTQLGLECAGRIVALGEGVTDFQVGDEVVCLAPASFASHVIADVRAVAKKPAGMTFEEAATLPVVYLTVYYGLHHLARLQPGERVLIHAATGGVGLAAIQYARLVGAEIFATAGSPEKRALLHALGVQHVMDSRSLDFADEVLAKTGGEGVDVVLNSLGGEALVRSIGLLRECGRFVELGKRDLEFNAKVGLRPFLRQLSFFAVDLDRLVASRPDVSTRLFAEVMALIDSGKLRPLPHIVYPVGRVREAFRILLKARHIGKVVLSMQEPFVPVLPAPRPAPRFRADGTYIVTGGLGGFGLATARWLVTHGARHLLLLGRNGANSPGAQQAIDQLQKAGANVKIASVNVASASDLAGVLAGARKSMPPLVGVFHAAMVLDDAPIAELTRERFEKVLAPKVAGAWNLHELTRNDPIEHFVLYSSVSAVVGNPAQANYVAANYYLDMLAHQRRALGLPALAVDWGVVRDVGVVAAKVALARHLENIGMIPLPAQAMLDALGVLMQTNAVQSTILRADWSLVRRSFPVLKDSPRLSLLKGRSTEDESQAGLKEGESLIEALAGTPSDERHPKLQGFVCELVARVLGTAASKLDTEEPLTKLGMDSLMAVELATRIKKEAQIDIPTMTFMRGPSISQLTTSLLELVLPQEIGTSSPTDNKQEVTI